jgi:hypothetical protein
VSVKVKTERGRLEDSQFASQAQCERMRAIDVVARAPDEVARAPDEAVDGVARAIGLSAHARLSDLGVRTGVKVAVVDATGKLLATDTVYAFQPKNDLRGA